MATTYTKIMFSFFIVAVAFCSCVSGNLLIVTDGNYSIGPAGNDYWLKSGPFFLHHNGVKLDSQNGTLKMDRASYASSGIDRLGNWQNNRWVFLNNTTNATLMEAVIKTYPKDQPNIVVFNQKFPNGLNSSRSPNNNFTITGFPTFRLSEDVTNTSLAYLMFAGYMMGDRSKVYGKWAPSWMHLPGGIDGSGPFVLYDQVGNVLIISFLDNAMAASVWQDGDVISWGIMGGVDEVPPGYSLQTIVYLGNQGVGAAFQEWGRVMRQWHGKTDDVVNYHQSQDITLTHLGYWTDNGAYYYYHTEGKNVTYEQTLPDVMNYATKQQIPYKYLQIDSWWYPKDKLGAVTTWDAMPSVFPHGLRNLSRALHQLPIAAHNRYWSKNTTYAKQNGGMFDFFIGHDLSLPTSFEFWDWLMKTSSMWGLRLYEQDWLNVQTLGTELLQTSVTAGSDWLNGMSRAARDHNMTVQYCMAQSRHGLHSMTAPEVTQARVTDDYHLKLDNWRIGVTSHFAWALGLAPSKDTFWTTSVENGNPFNKTEPYPEMQSAIATLSTGPVGPGDAINLTDRNNLMRCCAENGLILKPSKPATAIDAMFLEMGFGEGQGTSGEVWSTYSDFSDFMRFGIIFTFNVTRAFGITPTKAGFSPMVPPFPDSKIFSRHTPGNAHAFSDDVPYDIGPNTCDTAQAPHFCLFYTSPVLDLSGNEVLLLGELDKWVPMSARRVLAIHQAPLTLTVTLGGKPDERVTFSYLLNGVMNNVTVTQNQYGCGHVVINATSPTDVTTASTHHTTQPTEHTTPPSTKHTTTASGDVTTAELHNMTTESSVTTAKSDQTSTHTTKAGLAQNDEIERVFVSPFAAERSCRFVPPPFTPPSPTTAPTTAPAASPVTSEGPTSGGPTSHKPSGGASVVKASSMLRGVVVIVAAAFLFA